VRALAIARTNLRRMLRDRTNLIPMVAVPLVFVYLIGTQFGGEDQLTVGVVGSGPVANATVGALEESAVAVSRLDDAEALRDAVSTDDLDLGAILPDDAAEVLDAGQRLEVEVVIGDEGDGATLEPLLSQAVDEQALVPGVTAELAGAGAPGVAEVRPVVEAGASDLVRTSVAVVDPAGGEIGAGGGRFAESAAQQLTLMVFLYTLFSAVPLVQSRKLGLSRRMLATPTPMYLIVAGEAAGRWSVALAQGTWVLVATAVLFDVAWGNLPAAVLLLVVFGAVGAGAGMLLGTTLDDEGVVVGAAVLVGLSVAALGGAMVPAEIFSPTLETISRVTPHAWALDGFATVRDGGSLGDITTELAVLAGGAVGLLGAASWRLRRVLTRV
jgi:ABC-2 type transport system permease protein